MNTTDPDLKAECDLDAAWAWFRESGCSLTEYDIGAGGSYWRCRFGLIEFSHKTRDGAVLAAWRANNKEKGEG